MAINPRSVMEMECLDGVWEPIEDNKKYKYIGTVRFTLRPLEYPDAAIKSFVTRIKWIQPTPEHYVQVAPTLMVELSSFKESTEDGLERWEDSSEPEQEWMTEWKERDVCPRDSTTSARIPSPIIVDSLSTSESISTHKLNETGSSRAAKKTSSEDDDGDDSGQL